MISLAFLSYMQTTDHLTFHEAHILPFPCIPISLSAYNLTLYSCKSHYHTCVWVPCMSYVACYNGWCTHHSWPMDWPMNTNQEICSSLYHISPNGLHSIDPSFIGATIPSPHAPLYLWPLPYPLPSFLTPISSQSIFPSLQDLTSALSCHDICSKKWWRIAKATARLFWENTLLFPRNQGWNLSSLSMKWELSVFQIHVDGLLPCSQVYYNTFRTGLWCHLCLLWDHRSLSFPAINLKN